MIFTRFLLVSAIGLAVSSGSLIADPPAPRKAAAEEKIRSLLENPQSDSNSNDPILDDILQIIRQQGSVLDGSSLDPANGALIEPKSETAKKTPLAVSALSPADPSLAHAAKTAEALLRAARLLEQACNPQDTDSRDKQAELVLRMRVEASRLLSEKLDAHSIDAK
ncbi:hypothetical protein [Novipirellula aureliae]|nr:hypothetical protein [Novipirellula aureliae]